MNDRTKQLQKLLVEKNLDAFFVPMQDEFHTEYVAEHNNRLKYITNFTGSAGFAIIFKDREPAFFTDSRYTIQAKEEVKGFEIFDITKKSIKSFLRKFQNIEIGFDAKLHNVNFIKSLSGLNIVTCENLIDKIWQRKEKKTKKAFLLSQNLAGETAIEKLRKIAKNCDEKAKYLLITDPITICWLLNIRGFDLPHSPIVFCYGLISLKTELKINLYVDKEKIPDSIEKKYKDFLTVKHVQEIYEDLPKLEKTQLDPKFCPFSFYELIKNNSGIITERDDYANYQKAIKNQVEIEAIKKAHLVDAKALSEFFAFFEKTNQQNFDEFSVSERILQFRKKQKAFFSTSFDTIAGFAANGAVIHYRPEKGKAKKIEQQGLLLIDSGGQYYDEEHKICGTTDITRTIAIGDPSKEQIINYTKVLKGHIAIADAKFPQGTTGAQLDVLARKYLWQDCLDYAHGTGHGVGCFLNVHEGPCGIHKRADAELKEGMILSNEPGFYKEGEYGIRLENLVLVKKYKESFLQFETISLALFDKNLIDYNMLNREEKKWIEEYEGMVLRNL